MKTFLLFLIGIALLSPAQSQELSRELAPFEKIIVSPKINLILRKGNQESIKLVYANVQAGQINVLQNGRTLHVFLDDARIVEKRKRIYENNRNYKVSYYKNAVVTAYVTYRELKNLEVRGEEEITCDSLIMGDKFKLKAYGEANIYLANVKSEKFKAVLYGRNKVMVGSGSADFQKLRLYGENRINTRAFAGQDVVSRIYGEGKIMLTASRQFRFSSFGEPSIEVNGFPEVRKGIVIGRTKLNVR